MSLFKLWCKNCKVKADCFRIKYHASLASLNIKKFEFECKRCNQTITVDIEPKITIEYPKRRR